MQWQDRITVDPKVLVGKPIVKGTRISVEFVIDLLGRGWTTAQVLEECDHVTAEDVQACLAYASEVLKLERGSPTPVNQTLWMGELGQPPWERVRDELARVFDEVAPRPRRLVSSLPAQRTTAKWDHWLRGPATFISATPVSSFVQASSRRNARAWCSAEKITRSNRFIVLPQRTTIQSLREVRRQVGQQLAAAEPHVDQVAKMQAILVAVGQQLHPHQARKRYTGTGR